MICEYEGKKKRKKDSCKEKKNTPQERNNGQYVSF